MRDHRELRAFKIADDLALVVYRVTKEFPQDERFGMTSQTRRAAVSVASNIVEGCTRQSNVDFSRFIEIAYGSCCELSYQLSLARRLGFIANTETEELADVCAKTLAALLKAVRSRGA